MVTTIGVSDGASRKDCQRYSGKTVKDIQHKTRKRYSTEDKICIVPTGLCSKDSIA
ncbi:MULTISPECIES: hypothetical protein [unclassified Pseudovibrio]|uniref:hypothetical protein n=1 Tax=unclassified Pseudovibrio TaxID=2627060 RepID=UPI0007B177B5|nr:MULTISPECIES: hypothetical protein [unclassified Pseudovibrio]KZK95154.1 hypothetical protein PsW74_04114 [Pseudovibrio sp. W74]KZL07818.1 hypothetical protein PsAD14_03600 [Pseudovibrio sp. Ad14]